MPPRGRKRTSDQSVASGINDAPDPAAMAGQKIATKTASAEESPRKRQKTGVTMAQKQALIDNLQLEVTERARKLRAQYSLQAQGLRTRIEIRVNRIPTALRKLTMGDLLQKYSTDKPTAPKQPAASAATAGRTLPPVPEKDSGRAARPHAALAAGSQPHKRPSDYMSGGDKENQAAHLDNPKKRQRGGNAPAHSTQPAQVLSPASSNARLQARDRERTAAAPPPSPAKSLLARPLSPTKQGTATGILSSMVEKARATRAGTARKPTASSAAGSSAGGPAGATRTRGKGAVGRPASRSATTASRNARRISGISESSDASTSTVVHKPGRPASRMAAAATTATAATTAARKVTGAAAGAAPRKTVMSSFKKGVASAATKKASAAAAAASATASTTTRSGRVLRKRD